MLSDSGVDAVRKHCEPVNVRFHVVWICITLSVWEDLEVLGWATERRQMFLVWREGRINSRQCRAVIPVLFFHSCLLLLPLSLPRSLVRFLFLSGAVFFKLKWAEWETDFAPCLSPPCRYFSFSMQAIKVIFEKWYSSLHSAATESMLTRETADLAALLPHTPVSRVPVRAPGQMVWKGVTSQWEGKPPKHRWLG